MDQQIDEYLDKFVEDCLSSTVFSGKSDEEKNNLREKLRIYLEGVILHTLVDNLNLEQLERFNNVDPNSDQVPAVVEQLAAEVPGFMDLADEAFKKEVESIKQTGQIPAVVEDDAQTPEHSSW